MKFHKNINLFPFKKKTEIKSVHGHRLSFIFNFNSKQFCAGVNIVLDKSGLDIELGLWATFSISVYWV